MAVVHMIAETGAATPVKDPARRYCPRSDEGQERNDRMLSLDLQTVDLNIDGGVAWITLNRPDALNAWTRELGRELLLAVDHAADTEAVRAVVLTGAGRAFSSGADLKASIEPGESGEPDVLSALREVFNPMLLRVRTLPKPVIAAVNGPAVGIGCSLALAADLILAAESAYFLLAFANIGLTLDGGASTSLVARVGFTRAVEMAMLAERLPAERAYEWGLVNRVVADGELAREAGSLAARLAAGPPGSYVSVKRSLGEAAMSGFAPMLDLEAMLQQERVTSADFAEGVAAFLEKRPARFSGR
jgi:2-(1,2-epoxy-1,2-dihydrophenyl)acetyl-CoA isomerase